MKKRQGFPPPKKMYRPGCFSDFSQLGLVLDAEDLEESLVAGTENIVPQKLNRSWNGDGQNENYDFEDFLSHSVCANV